MKDTKCPNCGFKFKAFSFEENIGCGTIIVLWIFLCILEVVAGMLSQCPA